MLSKRERKWRRIYLFLMIFIYAIFVPVSALEWIIGEGRFPYTAIVVGFALPFIRKNHLTTIKGQS